MTKGTKLHSSDQNTMLPSVKTDIGQVVKEVLCAARDNNRLTCGLYESGLMLEMNPDSVMACVLPINDADDVTLDIHFTLIEAFCAENGIRILRVDSSSKLQELLDDKTSRQGNPKVTFQGQQELLYDVDEGFYGMDAWSATDYNCVLLEYPTCECSALEEDLLMYHKETSGQFPAPVILLDV